MNYDGYVRDSRPAAAAALLGGITASAIALAVGFAVSSMPWDTPIQLVSDWKMVVAALKAAGKWPDAMLRMQIAGGTGLAGAMIGDHLVSPLCGFKRSGDWLLKRGRTLAPPPSGARITKTYFQKIARRSGNRSRFCLAPGVPLPFEHEVMGILAVGAPGAGKSQIIEWLLARWQERGDTKLIVLDAGKGDYTSKWPVDDFYLLAPHDDRIQPGGTGLQAMAWDIAADCTSFQDAAEFAERVVLESKEPHWSDGARLILQGIIVGLQRTRGRKWGWADLHAAVIQSDRDLYKWMEAHFPEALSYVALDASGLKADKNAKSYINNFRATAIKMTKPLALAWGNTPANRRLSVRKWMLDQKDTMAPTIILGRTGQFSSMSAAWIGSLFRLLNGLVNTPALSESWTRRVILCLDELRTIAASNDPILQFVETGRSKGCGLVAAIQTFEQMAEESVWGQSVTKAFEAIMQTKLLGKIMATSDGNAGANAIAENLVGYEEVERWAPKNGKGDRTKEREKRLVVLPNFFEYAVGAFKDGAHAAILLPQHLALLKWPFSPWKPLRPPVIPARWIETMVSTLSPAELELLAADLSPDQRERLTTAERNDVLREALGITSHDPILDEEEEAVPTARPWGWIVANIMLAVAAVAGGGYYHTHHTAAPESTVRQAVVVGTAPAPVTDATTGRVIGTYQPGQPVTVSRVYNDGTVLIIDVPGHEATPLLMPGSRLTWKP